MTAEQLRDGAEEKGAHKQIASIGTACRPAKTRQTEFHLKTATTTKKCQSSTQKKKIKKHFYSPNKSHGHLYCADMPPCNECLACLTSLVDSKFVHISIYLSVIVGNCKKN